jgi:hypothetical protein
MLNSAAKKVAQPKQPEYATTYVASKKDTAPATHCRPAWLIPCIEHLPAFKLPNKRYVAHMKSVSYHKNCRKL